MRAGVAIAMIVSFALPSIKNPITEHARNIMHDKKSGLLAKIFNSSAPFMQ